jgi:hypothetical protein
MQNLKKWVLLSTLFTPSNIFKLNFLIAELLEILCDSSYCRHYLIPVIPDIMWLQVLQKLCDSCYCRHYVILCDSSYLQTLCDSSYCRHYVTPLIADIMLPYSSYCRHYVTPCHLANLWGSLLSFVAPERTVDNTALSCFRLNV